MAIGETVVGTLWTSFAGVCIEKLLDELLKVGLHSLSFSLSFFETFRMESIRKNRVQKNHKKHLKQQQQQQQHRHQQQQC